jgi:ABC-type antimicrobial peptide transport system permease subunit
MALGAFHRDVIWMVMREVIALVTIGIVAGFGAAMGLTQYVKSQLFGLTTMDPFTLAAAILGLAAVACLAGYIPALRASRVDAMQALRYE